MKIDKNNYEAFLLDYLEGLLTGDTLLAMESFLLAHPDIQAGLEGLESVRLEPPQITYPKRNELHRTLEVPQPYHNCDEWFAAYAGGDLAPDEMKQVVDFVMLNPSLEKSFQAYCHTRLTADLNIKYPDKASLKRSIPLYGFIPKIGLRSFTLAAAAAITLLITSVWVSRIVIQNDQAAPGMAVVEREIPDYLNVYRRSSQAVGEVPISSATEFTTQATQATSPIQPVAAAASQATGETPKSERDQLNIRLPYRDAQVILAAEHGGVLKPDIILPRYQFFTPNLIYLAGDLPMADAGNRSGVTTQIWQWLGFGRENTQAGKPLDPTTILWSLADRGVNVLNALTDNEIELLKAYDDSGNVVAYALVTDRFEVARKQQRD